jgi:hypothetical protein
MSDEEPLSERSRKAYEKGRTDAEIGESDPWHYRDPIERGQYNKGQSDTEFYQDLARRDQEYIDSSLSGGDGGRFGDIADGVLTGLSELIPTEVKEDFSRQLHESEQSYKNFADGTSTVILIVSLILGIGFILAGCQTPLLLLPGIICFVFGGMMLSYKYNIHP